MTDVPHRAPAHSRRTLLSAAAGGLGLLSGCQRLLGGEPGMLTVVVANYTTTEVTVAVEIRDEDAADRLDAELFVEEFTVGPPSADETAETARREDAVEVRPAVIRARIPDVEAQWRHLHYVPDAGANEHAAFWIRVYRDEATRERVVVLD